jgi:cytochrome c oxidase subunit 2
MRRPQRLGIAAAGAALASGACAAAELPMNFLSGAGTRANLTLPLTWGVLGISIAVVTIISLLTLVGVWRRADRSADALALRPHRRNASMWLYVGLGLSTAVLVLSMVWTVLVLRQISGSPPSTAMTIEVTGQQWWWKVRYLNDDPSRILTTANEIHIPTGTPVRVKLIAADVIHSFWVPQLGGKTDAIPGQTNVTWIQADRPGRYRGQCSEYCGVQHAHMAFEVVAQAPGDFARWLDAQLQPAAFAAAAPSSQAQNTFEFRCGVCHTVRGTRAGGTTAPDLTHLMTRSTIAALSYPNNLAMLNAWIANPQELKPGNHMPILQLSSSEVADLDAFLVTLK